MYVVNQNCLGCRFTDCVAVCPVKDCFKIGKNMVVIDPDLCIDCGLCVAACPAKAIESDLNSDIMWVEHNAKFSKIWPAINEMIEPAEGAQEMVNVQNKEAIFDKEEL